MRISVVCPVFDTPAPLLEAAVASVLAEAGSAMAELILVDDGSRKPATLATLTHLTTVDPRIVLLRTANGGPASARNAAIRRATGDWIGFIDADDLWLPGRQASFAAVLEAAPDAQWIAGRHRLLFTSGRTEAFPLLTETDLLPTPVAPDLARLEGPRLTQRLLGDAWLHLGGMLVRRCFFERTGGFHPGSFFHEDTLLIAELSTLTPLWMLNSEVYGWRREQDSLTVSPRRLTAASLTAYRAARRSPLLRDFRRETRWSEYSAVKGVALNNLLAGRRAAALGFALRAFAIDPTSPGELACFLRLLFTHPSTAAVRGRSYSTVDQFQARQSSS
ncbi:glycosyltransferase family 2 protein [Roseomonas nepalensis]|uniref:Glycosyltransferase family 2 protein n=1 Tax=Muricoccus nepalensis TaxID=1854500 RepID=A0A502FJM4_9PROT|nr:glycosyltransferase family A protein [Roseomonas nepalensis]TPG49579.1 glycosyltransferase family 2 protein [Roseomonas nepalensis]